MMFIQAAGKLRRKLALGRLKNISIVKLGAQTVTAYFAYMAKNYLQLQYDMPTSASNQRRKGGAATGGPNVRELYS